MLKTDARLQQDVMDELQCDPAVDRTEIGVAVRDGVVTLSGTVHSVALKDAAIRVTERVAGVRAIADELHVALPSSSKRTDTEIAHAVADRLLADVNIPAGCVCARVEDGWVSLEGETAWQYQRAAAEHAVRYLTGVTGVTNKITLKTPASVVDIRERIESALRRYGQLEAHQISIEAMEGNVTLRGKVRSWVERDEAERAAWSAPGVTSIDDQLAVSA
jgi:osmotically-inducible protein OsmY